MGLFSFSGNNVTGDNGPAPSGKAQFATGAKSFSLHGNASGSGGATGMEENGSAKPAVNVSAPQFAAFVAGFSLVVGVGSLMLKIK